MTIVDQIIIALFVGTVLLVIEYTLFVGNRDDTDNS